MKQIFTAACLIALLLFGQGAASACETQCVPSAMHAKKCPMAAVMHCEGVNCDRPAVTTVMQCDHSDAVAEMQVQTFADGSFPAARGFAAGGVVQAGSVPEMALERSRVQRGQVSAPLRI